MKATLKTWDATLAATPANRPAFLLDSLAPATAKRRARAIRHRPTPTR
jgi:hypothetical protein